MNLIRIAFLALLLPVVAHAQSGYKPGYIIKLNGDTLKGYINYSQRGVTPKTVDFKPELENIKAARFEPALIRGFGVTSIDQFLSYTGKVSMDRNKFPDVAATLDTTTAQSSMFLRVGYQGMPLSVFEQQDQLKVRLFVMEAGQLPKELIYYQFVDKNSGNGVRNVELYKDTLLAIAQKYNNNSARINSDINAASFTLANIINIARAINNDQSKNVGTMKVGLFAGIALNTVRTKMRGPTIFEGQSTSYTFPRLSIGLDIADDRYLRSFMFRLEASYTANQSRFYTKDGAGGTVAPVEYRYNFNQSLVTVTPQIIYHLISRQHIKAFIGIGLNMTYAKFSNVEFLRNQKAEDEPYKFSNSWLLFPLQAGVTLNKKVDIFVDYTLPATNATAELIKLRYTNYGIGFHYHFGK